MGSGRFSNLWTWSVALCKTVEAPWSCRYTCFPEDLTSPSSSVMSHTSLYMPQVGSGFLGRLRVLFLHCTDEQCVPRSEKTLSCQVECSCTLWRFMQAYFAPGTVWALSVCPQWLCLMYNLKPDVPPLYPASGDLAVHLHVVHEAWHMFAAVCPSCASCWAVAPPVGQTQASTSQTNLNNTKLSSQNFHVGKGN